MKEKIILKGIIQTFSKTNSGSRIYNTGAYQRAIDEYNKKLLYEKRKNIAQKILKECE